MLCGFQGRLHNKMSIWAEMKTEARFSRQNIVRREAGRRGGRVQGPGSGDHVAFKGVVADEDHPTAGALAAGFAQGGCTVAEPGEGDRGGVGMVGAVG